MLHEIILLDCLESWVRESLWRGIMKEFICGMRREMVFHLSVQVKLFSFASCVFIKCPQCVHTDCDLGTSRVLGFWRTIEKKIYERKVLSGTLLFQLSLDQSWQGLGNQLLNVGCVQLLNSCCDYTWKERVAMVARWRKIKITRERKEECDLGIAQCCLAEVLFVSSVSETRSRCGAVMAPLLLQQAL